MGATITLKNMLNAIYASLKRAADAHHQSNSSEAIACLERGLLPSKFRTGEHVSRARRIRESLKGRRFRVADIRSVIDDGRR